MTMSVLTKFHLLTLMVVATPRPLFDSRCQSFTAQSVVHLTDLVSLREALLDARRDTVTHRATIEDPEARA